MLPVYFFYTFLLHIGFNLFSFIARYEVVFFYLECDDKFSRIVFVFSYTFVDFLFLNDLNWFFACLSIYLYYVIRILILRPINTIKIFHQILGQSFLWLCKTASKILSKNSDGLWQNRNPSYFSKNFDALWRELTKQNIIRIKIYVNKSTWVWIMATERSKFVWSNKANWPCERDNFDKFFFEQTQNFDHVNRLLSRTCLGRHFIQIVRVFHKGYILQPITNPCCNFMLH